MGGQIFFGKNGGVETDYRKNGEEETDYQKNGGEETDYRKNGGVGMRVQRPRIPAHPPSGCFGTLPKGFILFCL